MRFQSLRLLAAGTAIAAIALLTAVTFSGCGGGTDGNEATAAETAAADAGTEMGSGPAHGGRRLPPEVPASQPERRLSTEDSERTYTTVLTSRQAVTVMSRIAGTVTALEVEEGDRVRTDEVLARFDDRSRRIVRNGAAAEAQRTRALYERNREAFVSSGAVRVVSALELEVSEAEYLKAQADSALAELELSYTLITAPFDGVVTERFIETGEWVASQEDLFTVADLNRLWAIYIIPAQLQASLQPGQTLPLRISNGGQSIDAEGRLVRTSPVVDPASGGVKITVEIANSRRLFKPGMTATLELDASGG